MSHSRRAGILLVVLLMLFVTALCLSQVSALAEDGTAVQVLQPLGAFAIPTSSASHIDNYVVEDGSIFYLEKLPSFNALVEVSHTGTTLRTTVLPTDGGYISTRLCLGAGQLPVVLQRFRERCRLVFINESGRISNIAVLNHTVSGLTYSDRLIGLDVKNSVLRSEPDEQPIIRLRSGASHQSEIVGLSSGRVAVIETGETPRMQLLGLSGNIYTDRQLVAPELPWRSAPKLPPNVFENRIFSTVSDGRGGLVAVVSGYTPGSGSVILRFDGEGKLSDRYRCKFPPQSHGEAFTVVSAIGATGDRLLLFSSHERRAALYRTN